MTNKQIILLRVYLSFIFMGTFAGIIIYYAYRIQFLEGDKWKELQTSQTTEYRTIQASRGNIYAADGSLLATSVPVYNIIMDTRANGLTEEIWKSKIDSLALMLSTINTEKSKTEYLILLNKARKKKDRYLPLLKKISYEQLKLVKKFPIFSLGKNKGGLLIEEQDIRETPFGQLAFRTIGYNREGIAGVGIEAAYNEELKGRSGKRLMQKIVGGNWLPISDENDIEPMNGYDIYTTIDIVMQDLTENALKQALIQHQASHGCVILMETKTGEIKAIANLTRYNDDHIIEDKNYALGEITEPGSTFKLASVLSLLEDGYVNDYETVSSEDGTTKFADRIMRDSEHGGHGLLTLQKAFELSSNVGISKFIWKYYKNNPTKYINHLVKDFHLGEHLHSGLPGEGIPKIKTPHDKTWSEPTLPWMSIGYEVLVTPMQILALYNAVANNGVMVKPLFVKKVEQTGKLIKEYHTEVLVERIVSEQTIKRVMPMLRGVVEHGTATNIQSKIYPIAGKTGTARIVERGEYVEQYKSSFCGFFPADKPQYTCMVMIFKPSNGVFYGSLVAGPVFKEIADKVYATCVNRQPEKLSDTATQQRDIYYTGYSDDYRIISGKGNLINDDSWSKVVVNKNGTKTSNIALNSKNQMPDVVGMGMRDAVYLLENRGLKVQYTGKGKVKNQSIPKGTKIYKGTPVMIELM